MPMPVCPARTAATQKGTLHPGRRRCQNPLRSEFKGNSDSPGVPCPSGVNNTTKVLGKDRGAGRGRIKKGVLNHLPIIFSTLNRPIRFESRRAGVCSMRADEG